LTFDLLNSKSNQFISTPNCTEVVNLVKFLQAACTVHKLLKQVKAEHLYSALHGIQTTLKRSGMDHTVVLPASLWSIMYARNTDGQTDGRAEYGMPPEA